MCDAGLLFFVLLFLGLRNMFVALFTFPDEYKIMLKERASGMYKLSAFYIARTMSVSLAAPCGSLSCAFVTQPLPWLELNLV